MPFSRKGLDDGRCEIQRLFWFTAVCSCYIGLTLKMHEAWGYSFREEKVEILSNPTELEGERELKTREQPDIEVTKASFNLIIGPFAI